MRRTGLSLGALVGTLAMAGCGGSPEAKPADRSPSPPPPPRIESTRRSVEPLEIPSVLSVEHEVDLLAEHDGLVEEILRDQGSPVEKGTVLCRLDDRDLLADLDRARANLEVAEDNVKYNEAELKAKQANYRRFQELSNLGLVSQAQLEQAEFEAKGAGYDLDSWKASAERARAEIRKAEIELEKTRIHASFSGVVTRRYIREGQHVLKNDKCFRLSQLQPLQVRFLVPETTGRRPRVGDPVKVVAVSDPGRLYPAEIQKVNPVVDAASGGIEVTAQLGGADPKQLSPGMAVRVLWSGVVAPDR